jgi:hypothetical protein
VAALAGRTVFEATVVRPPGVPWVIDGARLRNQLEVHRTNKTGAAVRYRLEQAVGRRHRAPDPRSWFALCNRPVFRRTAIPRPAVAWPVTRPANRLLLSAPLLLT